MYEPLIDIHYRIKSISNTNIPAFMVRGEIGQGIGFQIEGSEPLSSCAFSSRTTPAQTSIHTCMSRGVLHPSSFIAP